MVETGCKRQTLLLVNKLNLLCCKGAQPDLEKVCLGCQILFYNIHPSSFKGIPPPLPVCTNPFYNL